MTRDNKELIVGLDIGTSKVVALVGELDADGAIRVIGAAAQPSRGLRRGVVVNIEETVQSIARTIHEVEEMAHCKVSTVYTGIAGAHINSTNRHGSTAIKEKEVTELDVERVMETARAMPMPADQEILHVLTQEYIIDGQGGIRDPIGMSGLRLEAKVHIVLGAVSAAQNIIKCVRRCGLEVQDLILQPLASSYAVLSDDEKDLGVCLVDIGGGTTDIAIWSQGAIRYTSVIPIAGDQITNDIAMALRTPTREAEDIKLRYGCALSQLADPEEILEVAGVDDRPSRKLSRRALADVIQPRVEELYELIAEKLKEAGFEDLLSSGIVITGGASLMEGMRELGEEILHLPVRIGTPKYNMNMADLVRTPRFSTAFGLLLEAQKQQAKRGQKVQETRSVRDVFARMKSWFSENF
jgi:cell division protein FtsA